MADVAALRCGQRLGRRAGCAWLSHVEPTMNDVQCPFCGEVIEIWVDPGGPSLQEYVEDCSVCCRPIRIVAERQGADEDYSVWAHRE